MLINFTNYNSFRKSCQNCIMNILVSIITLSCLMTTPFQQAVNLIKKCPFGNFLTSTNNCVQCLTSCSKCTSLKGTCPGCSQGLKLNSVEDKCQKCNPGFLWCDQNQLKCQPHYRLQENKCIPQCMVQNCEKCTSLQTLTCTSCYAGYTLSSTLDSCLANSSISNPSLKFQSLPKCGRGEFLDATTGCQKCSEKCKTCVNSADQCLQCNADFFMRGWKCVTFEHLTYNLTLSPPQDKMGSVLSDGINQIKNQIISNILPSQYLQSGLSALTLSSASFVNNELSLNGFIDKLNGLNISQVNSFLNNKLKTMSLLGPYQIISSSVKDSSLQLSPLLTDSNSSANSSSDGTSSLSSGVDLAKILIPSIVVGLAILLCLICGVCACCKCCCFRKRKDKNVIMVLESERVMMPKSVEQLIKPGITPLSPVAPPQSIQVRQSLKRVGTIPTTTSIDFAPVQQKQKLRAVTSLDSLEERYSNNLKSGEKIIMNVRDDLKQSIPNQEIRMTVVPSKIVNSKVVAANNLETQSPKYQYKYINERNEEVKIKNLPRQLASLDDLEKLGVKPIIHQEEL